MKTFKTKTLHCMLAMLAVVATGALSLTSCDNPSPEILIEMESDYSQIISEIRGVNATLTEKLAAIEQKMADGFADNAAALAAIKAAVASLEGTTAEKLAAIETAMKAQTTSLETKLALVEAAVESGFADTAAAQGLIKEAITSLDGTMAEKLAAIDAAVKAQTASLESKLALIEKAIETGFADSVAAQGLIKDAIETLQGSTEEKLAAVESAVKAQTSSLESKLALVETAVETGFATSAQAQGLIKSAMETLQGSVEEKLAAISKAVTDQTTSFGTKLAAIEEAIENGFADSAKAQGLIEQAIKTLDSNMAAKLAEILQAITGRPDYSGDLDDIKKAIETLRKMFVLRVELDKTDMTLAVGGTATLTATVFPDDATDKSVTWKSSDPAVAEVSPEGIVSAKAAGSAIITVTTSIGGMTAECDVTVKPGINGYEYVDMGITVNGKSIKWATMNIGASKPEDYGDYFAWGETTKKDDYSWGTYLHANGSQHSLTKYCNNSSYGDGGYTDTSTVLEESDDAARVKWGGSWRMPTAAELKALADTKSDTQNYEWTWCDGTTEKYNKTDVKGWKIERKSTGATLFLPAAGYRRGAGLDNDGSYGYYWSSSLLTGSPDGAWYLYFSSDNVYTYNGIRFLGFTVRPVTD